MERPEWGISGDGCFEGVVMNLRVKYGIATLILLFLHIIVKETTQKLTTNI